MRWIAVLLTIVLLACALPIEAHALAVMFTDRTAWQTAVDLAGLQREAVDLSGIPDGNVTEFPLPFGETMLTNPSGDLKSGDAIIHTTPATINTFDPAPFTGAFGFDMGPVGLSGLALMSLTLDDGSTLSKAVAGGTVSFFGWIGGTTTSMTFGCTTGECEDFQYTAMEKAESPAPVPEPGSAVLMGSLVTAASAWVALRKRRS